MSQPLERLEARLRAAGWDVRDRQSGPAEEQVRPITWALESRRVPVGARVGLHLRVWERWGAYYEWHQDQLTALTVRYPAGVGAEPSPEATLVGNEIERGNWRQLVHILEWFRDPLGGTFWDDPPSGAEWQPPTYWLSERLGQQAALEQHWARGSDAPEMLRLLPGRASDRKLRLIACACARLLRASGQEHNHAAVDAAERYADGLCPRREAKKLCKHSDLAWLAHLGPAESALHAIRLVGAEQLAAGRMRAADVVRDVLGDPFRPVVLRHEWLRNEGGAVAHLATAIDRDGRYEDVPILADALEDAGCRVSAVLEHCRAGVKHARGCWVIDLLLGRA
jgi:hypothetical protein